MVNNKFHTQHIILVSIDTLRADCINASPRAKDYLSKYQTKTTLKTGSLDSIVRSSLYYDNCYSAAPYTSASHAAYFTGRLPLHNGIYEFFNRKLIEPTIFEYSKKQGYKTIFQTDFPIILGHPLGFTKGIDHYFIENEDKAFKALVDNKCNNTLSFFHFGGVHYPYGFHTLKFGGKDYIKKINMLEKKYRISSKTRGELDDVLNETYRNKQDTELLLRYKYIIFEKLYKLGLYDELFGMYLEGINYFLEHRFNKFIMKIKNFVDKHNALLFIFSDHGEEWDAFSEGHHNTLSDNVLRVPLMVYGNQIQPRIEKRLVRTIDLAPTIIDLLPNNIRTNLDGVKLDIFNSNGKEVKAQYAISQVYTSIATKKQTARYQNMSIKKNKTVKPLDTYLSGEVIRTKDRKLLVYYYKNGSVRKKEIQGNATDLKKILIKYNSDRNSGRKTLSKIKSKIRNELNNLGYNV